MADDPIIFKTLPKALQELRTSSIKKTADGRFSILKRLKKTPFNDHIAVKSVQATAKLALVVAPNIAFGIYNTIDDAAMKSQLRRCQDQRNKKFGISCFGRAKHSRLSQLLSYMDRNLAQVLGKIEAQGCNNVWNRLWTHFRPDSRCATLKELARCKQAVGEKVESK